jgi:kynurenine formamidase
LDYPSCKNSEKFRVQNIHMPAACGTHLDAPSHCIPGGWSISDLPFERLEGPGALIDIALKATETYSLSTHDILQFENAHGKIEMGAWVLIRTGWEKHWFDPERYRNNHCFPSVSLEAAQCLLDRDVTGIAIDTLSPDRPMDGYPVHQRLLAHQKLIVENAAHLEGLPAKGFRVFAMPLKMEGATESPIRLFACI